MMHSRSFDLGKKQNKNYSIKTEIRDAKSMLILYRCIFSFVLFIFAFVIKQILEVEHVTDTERVDPSFTKKVIALILIGACSPCLNVTVAKNMDQLFKHFFYKTCLIIMDYFVKIALLVSSTSFLILF